MYVRTASMVRKIYIRKGMGVGRLDKTWIQRCLFDQPIGAVLTNTGWLWLVDILLILHGVMLSNILTYIGDYVIVNIVGNPINQPA